MATHRRRITTHTATIITAATLCCVLMLFSGTETQAMIMANGIELNGMPANGMPYQGLPRNGMPFNGLPAQGERVPATAQPDSLPWNTLSGKGLATRTP